MPPAEQIGPDHIGRDRRVVQRRAGAAVFGDVEALEKIGHLGDGNAHRAAHGAKGRVAFRRDQRLVGHVQRHHHNWNAGSKHDISGFRVDVDVEFSRRGYVANLEIGATHQHDLGHAAHDVGGAPKGAGDVGQRPQRAQGDAAGGVGAQAVDDEIDPMARGQRHRRVRQHRAVKPGLAMHMLGRDQRARQRRVAP